MGSRPDGLSECYTHGLSGGRECVSFRSTDKHKVQICRPAAVTEGGDSVRPTLPRSQFWRVSGALQCCGNQFTYRTSREP